MAKDTVTLALAGEVLFGHFAGAISHLHALIEALSDEMGATGAIEWMVHDLQAGSAVATIRGESTSVENVERVVSAYGSLGKDLEMGKRPQFSERVLREAYAITRLLNNRITSVRFETPDTDATILSHGEMVGLAAATTVAQGAIEGRVQTLSNRKGLRFNLYDALHDRAVSCYLDEGREEVMREIWGRRVLVEGEITRDVETGRPLIIRHIKSVAVLEEVAKGSYLAARGVSPRRPGSLLPEETIRQVRDA